MKKILLPLIWALLISQASFAQETHVRESININKASAQQIADTLDGIGLKKAEAIIQYRKQHGVFSSADALMVVKGIGEATIEKNRRRIRTK